MGSSSWRDNECRDGLVGDRTSRLGTTRDGRHEEAERDDGAAVRDHHDGQQRRVHVLHHVENDHGHEEDHDHDEIEHGLRDEPTHPVHRVHEAHHLHALENLVLLLGRDARDQQLHRRQKHDRKVHSIDR